jgi:hypothetical protein
MQFCLIALIRNAAAASLLSAALPLSAGATGVEPQREQDEFIARRNAAFGRPDYDLHQALRERLDHLLAVERY